MSSLIGTPRQLVFAGASVAMGAWAWQTTTALMTKDPAFAPQVEACMTLQVDEVGAKYHAYEPLLGLGLFPVPVCIATQFLYQILESFPAGELSWGAMLCGGLPYWTLSTLQAGRTSSRWNLTRYPLFLGLLIQFIGFCVVVPLLWVPSYIYAEYSTKRTREKGASAINTSVSPFRAAMSVGIFLPVLGLTALVFSLDLGSYEWTLAAGILLGPLLPVALYAGLWLDRRPSPTDMDTTSATVTAFRIAAFIAFLLYVVLGALVYTTIYTTAVAATRSQTLTEVALRLYQVLWIEASPCIQFIVIDAVTLFASLWLLVAYRDLGAALVVVAYTPLIGPGAALAWALGNLEKRRVPSSSNEPWRVRVARALFILGV